MPTTLAPEPVVEQDLASVVEPDPRPVNPYASAYANFAEQTAEHALTVIQDHGLHRQLRVGAPGTGIWSWGVTTWPGYLATFGDVANGYMFTRDIDMIDFFDRGIHRDYYSDGAPSIDFRYWAEKLSGRRSHDVREFSEEVFLRHVADDLAEHETLGDEAQKEFETIVEVAKRVCARNGVDYDEYVAELHGGAADDETISLAIDPDDNDEVEYFGQPFPYAVDHYGERTDLSPAQYRARILDEAKMRVDYEHEAREWLEEDEQVKLFGEDTWEWDYRDYDVCFLFACYAIAKTVELWRQYEKSNDTVALDPSSQAQSRSLIAAARDRVDTSFKVVSHGEVGQPSNGALLVRLADRLAEQLAARPAYVPQEVPAGDTYVLVEGGLVQNSTSLPVFNVDVLSDDSPNRDTAGEAADVYLRIYEHPDARADLGGLLTRLADFVRDHGCTKDIARVEEYEVERLKLLADSPGETGTGV